MRFKLPYLYSAYHKIDKVKIHLVPLPNLMELKLLREIQLQGSPISSHEI